MLQVIRNSMKSITLSRFKVVSVVENPSLTPQNSGKVSFLQVTEGGLNPSIMVDLRASLYENVVESKTRRFPNHGNFLQPYRLLHFIFS